MQVDGGHRPDLGDADELLADWALMPAPQDRLPGPWRGLLTAATAADRRRIALARWPAPVTGALPRFVDALAERLTDVRPALSGGTPVLVYLARGDDGGPRAWVGFAPRRPDGPPPRFWSAVPAALRAFLEQVHAGFVAADGESYGPLPPRLMRTLADRAATTVAVPGGDTEGRIPPDRLVRVATNGALLDYCASPDIPEGQLALVYEGDIDLQEAGAALDALMLSGFDDA